MESFHLQLSQLPDEIALDMASNRVLVYRDKEEDPTGDLRYYWISVPPALGPVALVGDKAYVSRFWPRELAVLDISDPRRRWRLVTCLGNHPPNWSSEENSSIPWHRGVVSGLMAWTRTAPCLPRRGSGGWNWGAALPDYPQPRP